MDLYKEAIYVGQETVETSREAIWVCHRAMEIDHKEIAMVILSLRLILNSDSLEYSFDLPCSFHYDSGEATNDNTNLNPDLPRRS